MVRFSDLVTGQEVVRVVLEEYPETRPVFQKYRLRPHCQDCPVVYAAKRAGAPIDDLLVELNATIYKTRGMTAPARNAANHV